ncbi:carotenoid 1,2-hydratase [Bacteroidota bacterium]|jgi:predicted secreted hydrolase|nr:carotenoid 1,2-hydratase [Bacteroidota bacterium]
MKLSFWQIITIPILVGLALSWILFSEPKAEIEATISAAQALSGSDTEGFTQALAPREFVFPGDHGAHPGFKTEWWYYTGNLFTEEGRQFGYQFTIFRNQLSPSDADFARINQEEPVLMNPEEEGARDSEWSTNQLYLAHFAISDVSKKDHVFDERYSRGTAGLAGASVDPYRIWLEDWEITRVKDSKASDERFQMRIKAEMSNGTALDIVLNPQKPLVLQGEEGYDKKGGEDGNASYYISFTRMQTEGLLKKEGESLAVSGLSWMDHEWSTSALDSGQTGWDWFSIQLSNGYELMYYQIRNVDPDLAPQTTGSLVTPNGQKRDLDQGEVRLEVLEYWASPHTGARYPVQWTLAIPSEELEMDVITVFDDQEMTVSVQYYEGALQVSGKFRDEAIDGNGYIEMTGYEQD